MLECDRHHIKRRFLFRKCVHEFIRDVYFIIVLVTRNSPDDLRSLSRQSRLLNTLLQTNGDAMGNTSDTNAEFSHCGRDRDQKQALYGIPLCPAVRRWHCFGRSLIILTIFYYLTEFPASLCLNLASGLVWFADPLLFWLFCYSDPGRDLDEKLSYKIYGIITSGAVLMRFGATPLLARRRGRGITACIPQSACLLCGRVGGC